MSRILADAGYKGHAAPEELKFKVYTQGQKRSITTAIKRQLKGRIAIEPVIGHGKEDHRMGRNFLAHRDGDAINAVLAAAGYNFPTPVGLARTCFALAAESAYARARAPENLKSEVHGRQS